MPDKPVSIMHRLSSSFSAALAGTCLARTPLAERGDPCTLPGNPCDTRGDRPPATAARREVEEGAATAALLLASWLCRAAPSASTCLNMSATA